ncbi:hypothetical protein [Bacteroides sp.]|uniref:hypothetical protein n=1 Tax=Bacteroides sp. TaxID=29523 RepID=UPI0026350135|nr:hypothetical protein [Bacteroides sp.]MDD3040576.1 hypothetical protein [Bacteroides sp.]
MIDLTSFSQFFADYKTGTDNNRKFSRLDHLVTSRLTNYICQPFDQHPVLNLETENFGQYGTIAKMHPEFVCIKRGPFLYTVFNDRAIFIENPTEDRMSEICSIPDTYPFRRAPVNRAVSWCDAFVITTHGDVWFRDTHKNFYDLVAAGSVHEAMAFATQTIDQAIGR